MSFNELNSVEHYIIHQLSGVNLNTNEVQEPTAEYGTEWVYQSSEQIQRGVKEVLAESEFKEALARLNPEIANNPALADEVIYKLRVVLITVNQVGLVKANEEFCKWLTGDKTMPFGENNRHVPIQLIDFDDLTNNRYVITNQFRIHQRETRYQTLYYSLMGFR